MSDARVRTHGVVPEAAEGQGEVPVDPTVAAHWPERLPLVEGWDLQSSAGLGAGGDLLSTTAFRPQGWHPASAPTTVFAALVAQGLYPDPFFGMNLRQAPGMDYPPGANFSNLPMAEGSPFAVPWWYRKEFVLPRAAPERIWLHLEGLNYRAALWFNGHLIAGPDTIAGALRTHCLDVTAAARPGRNNVLAIEVHPPRDNDLAITFVDWNPLPPDKNMGLWREVYLSASGPAVARHPAVLTTLDGGGARIAVTALVENATDRPFTGTVTARVRPADEAPGGVAFDLAQPVSLGPRQRREVTFAGEAFPSLRVDGAALWWPAQMGTPRLHDLVVEVHGGEGLSHRAGARVGFRQITSELTAEGHRLFRVNGLPILVRAAGWSPDMMLRQDPDRLADELAYARDIGLNTVRLEGKMEGEEFFALTDRLGLLVMAGWCCCDHWERWPRWSAEDHQIAEASQRSQLQRLRSHPSLLVWLNGSDHAPPPEVEERYLAAARDALWPNPVISSGTAQSTSLSGPSGLKMTGPYDYVVPSYWLTDQHGGGAHGFNTETSAGPAIPPLASLRRMLPEDHLWPIDEHWRHHAGGGQFQDLTLFTEALAGRYGEPRGLEDFLLKADLMAYEGVRAMFEGFSRNKYRATGVVQWMLNNAWPSLIWHLYDHLLRPAGGYFGAKKACSPLHPLYGYDDGAVWLVNSRYQAASGATVTARLFDLEGKERGAARATVDAGPDSSQRVLDVPHGGDAGPVSFLHLTVTGSDGRPAGANFYWLSRKPEVIDWEAATWYTTPTQSFADYSALQRLPAVPVGVEARSERDGDETVTRVMLRNDGDVVAFFVQARVTRGPGGEEVLPVRWEDNYLSLLPGETRTIAARYRTRDLAGAAPAVALGGWNVAC
jgi:exo-1,4-beta-D-glucosaminidase